MSSGKYGGRIGIVARYEPVLEAAGGYPYTVSFGDKVGAFKAGNLQRVEMET
jgi:hypothetical protein